MHLTVYGIPNCDSVKKARTWLADHGLSATFHDFKKQGVPAPELDRWLLAVGWDTLLNRKGSTWRKLEPALQASVIDSDSAKAVMLAHASTIKRPVMVWPSGQITVGFVPAQWPA
jgi:Spx/MgsR family transcriptional regulator